MKNKKKNSYAISRFKYTIIELIMYLIISDAFIFTFTPNRSDHIWVFLLQVQG